MLRLNLRKLILYFLAVLYTGGVYGQETLERTANKTVIRLADSAGFTPAFFFSDQFNHTDPPFSLSEKKKEQQIEIENPTLLFDAATGVPFYILPGEVVDVMPPYKDIRLLTSSDERNNELAFFAEFNKKRSDYFRTNAAIRLGGRIASAVYPSAEKAENDKEQHALAFLEQYQKERPMSEEFQVFARRFFHYLKTANLFTVLGSNTIQVKDPPAFENMKERHTADYTCDSCLNNIAYRISATAYQQYLVKNSKSNDGGIIENTYDITANAFSGETREFLLFIMFKAQMGKGLTADNASFKRFISSQNSNNFRYVEYLRKESDRRSSPAGDKELVDAANIASSWDHLIVKHRGKLILVDFWASWCVPCRRGMPDTKSLARDYPEDQLKVLFISEDESHNDWLKATKSESLPSGDSFIIANYKKSKLKERLKLSSIPRYMLIDQQGNLIDDNAPHPGTVELKQLLEKYL